MFYTYYVKAEGKYYFGSRTPEFMLNKAAKDDFMIHYFTSTSDERLREIIRNKEYEKAEIIKEYTDRKECLKDEERLIKIFWAFYSRKNCWNHRANDKFSTAGTTMSDEAKAKAKETWNNKSEEEIEEWKRKCGDAARLMQNSMSTEDKINRNKKISETKQNKSPEEKEIESNKKKNAFANMPLDKKAERSKKISKAKKGSHHSAASRKKMSIAKTGKKVNMSDEKRKEKNEKISKANSGERNGMYGKPAHNRGKSSIKYYWQTPDGEIRIMDKACASHHHPDWTFIGPVENNENN